MGSPNGHQGLVHVMGAHVDCKHVGSRHRRRKYAGFGVKTAAKIGVTTCKPR